MDKDKWGKFAHNRRTERVVLAFYCAYTVIIGVFVWAFGTNTWITPMLIMFMMVGIVIHISEFKTYTYRAYIVAMLCYFDFVVCTISANNFDTVFPFSIALMIVFALYEIPSLINLGTTCYTGLLIYNILFANALGNTPQELVQVISQLAAVYLCAYILRFLNKKHGEIHEELYKNIDALERAEQSKDDFLANVSHEIRTPVNVICGIGEIMLQGDLEPEVCKNVFEIQTAGMHLSSLISDILDFSELQSEKATIIEESYNITSTINDIINMTNAKNDEKGLEIVVDCDIDMPCGLIGDEQKIRRAVMNIVDNAIKFTDEGGIVISVHTRNESYGANLCIQVQDTGVGIMEKDLEKIFNSYNQVDTRRNRQESGLGLGLAVARTIVEKMGGFISIESSYGIGTTVSIVVPQRMDNTEPIISLNKPEKLCVLTYMDFAGFKHSVIREGYEKSILKFMKQSRVESRYANNIEDVKHFLANEKFTHLLVGWKEFSEDRLYFEGLSKQLEIILICDYKHTAEQNFKCIYKPFYALSIAAALNGEKSGRHSKRLPGYKSFKAPEARVLVVDDNIMNLKVVEGLLAPYAIKVSVAESGQEALRKIEQRNFDFIFMDHMMPVMDGVETFHRIRQKSGSYYQDVPIIALTANAVAGAKEMFLTEGFNDYITKPLELSALERILKKFIPAEKIIREETEDIKEEQKEDVPRGENVEWGSIDSEKGLEYCGGNYKDYLEILRMYHTAGEKKLRNIQTACEKKDWKLYEVETHSLKSMSLNIGAVKLSEMAKKLEAAGKAADEIYIRKHTEETLEEYRKILDTLHANTDVFPAASQEESEMQEITRELLLEKLDLLKAQLDTFESAIVMESLEELTGYHYNGREVKDLLAEVCRKVNEFDFMGGAEILDEIRKELEV